MHTNTNNLHLKFDRELEDKYNAHTTMSQKRHIRVAYLSFAVLFGIFSVTDCLLAPQWFQLFFVLRFYIVIPTLLVTIALTFHTKYHQWEQAILLFGLVIGGTAVSIMLILEPANTI